MLVAVFAAKEKRRILTREEFISLEPERSKMRAALAHRYFIDRERDSLLSLIVPDYGKGILSPWRCARRVRKEIECRRNPKYPAWSDLISERKFQIVVVTPFGQLKADAVEECLQPPAVPSRFVAVEGLEELFLWEGKRKRP